MPDMSTTRRLPLAAFRPSTPTSPSGPAGWAQRTQPAWWPAWSVPAAMRAARAIVVIPSLFALTYEGFGNLQMALFAAFGGFANLVVASFGGSRRDKAVAHFMLALIGSIGLIIGTAVHGIQWLAVLVTIPVTFGIFFLGVTGPNAASGIIAALFPYVLPVATAGTVSMIPDRLAGGGVGSGRAPGAGGGGRRGPGAGHRAGRGRARHGDPSRPPGLPGRQARADERVRQHTVPADRAGHLRPGPGQRGAVPRMVHRAGGRRHRRAPEPGPRRPTGPRPVRRDRRRAQADRRPAGRPRRDRSAARRRRAGAPARGQHGLPPVG